jgi:hypothetical protein
VRNAKLNAEYTQVQDLDMHVGKGTIWMMEAVSLRKKQKFLTLKA